MDLGEGTLTVNHNIAHAHGRPYLDEPKTAAGQRTIALATPPPRFCGGTGAASGYCSTTSARCGGRTGWCSPDPTAGPSARTGSPTASPPRSPRPGCPRYGARPAARRSHLCHRAVGTGAAGRGVHRPTRPRRFAGSSVGPRGGSLLRAKQEGAIIGVHSVLSWYAVAGVYSATMAALWSRRTRCAPELAPAGVHVVGVHTGYVRHLHGRAHHRPQDGPRGPRAQCLRRHSGG